MAAARAGCHDMFTKLLPWWLAMLAWLDGRVLDGEIAVMTCCKQLSGGGG